MIICAKNIFRHLAYEIDKKSTMSNKSLHYENYIKNLSHLSSLPQLKVQLISESNSLETLRSYRRFSFIE